MHTILHVEPSTFFTEIVHGILREKGYEYITTDSYNEALMLLDDCEVDLLLASLEGKGMKSDEFIKNVTYSHEDLPICILSGNKLNANMQQFMNLGIVQYIDKEDVETALIKYIEEMSRDDKYLEIVKDSSFAVIEDSHFSRIHLKDIFNKYGIKDVKYFASGSEMMAHKEEFDVYLVDLVLEDEFGKNIIYDLREKSDDALIFAVTSLDNPKLLADVIDSGANDIINKPIQDKVFIAKLKSYMRRRK